MAGSGSLVDRMIRAAKLDPELYEEVEADTKANWQAFTVVVIVSLIAGIGSALFALTSDDVSNSNFFWGLLLGVVHTLLGWLLWSLIVFIIGITFFKTEETKADYGQLLRTLGFANTPNILAFFVFLPFLGWLLLLIGVVWIFIAGVIAVRQALDFSTGRAIGTCIVGLIPSILLMWFLYGGL